MKIWRTQSRMVSEGLSNSSRLRLLPRRVEAEEPCLQWPR